MNKTDTIKDWYKISEKLEGKGAANSFPVDKNFKTHLVYPCEQIAIIGQTGSGKSTAIVEFLSRKTDAFFDITIFVGSTTNEPLYEMLRHRIQGIKITDKFEEIPELTSFNEDEKHERLMVWDDCMNLSKKEFIKIQKYFASSRKYGFTNIILAQNYSSIPLQIRRNIQDWWIFRLNDSMIVKQILGRNVTSKKDKEYVLRAYMWATDQPKSFFRIDIQHNRYFKNFTTEIQL